MKPKTSATRSSQWSEHAIFSTNQKLGLVLSTNVKRGKTPRLHFLWVPNGVTALLLLFLLLLLIFSFHENHKKYFNAQEKKLMPTNCSNLLFYLFYQGRAKARRWRGLWSIWWLPSGLCRSGPRNAITTTRWKRIISSRWIFIYYTNHAILASAQTQTTRALRTGR